MQAHVCDSATELTESLQIFLFLLDFSVQGVKALDHLH